MGVSVGVRVGVKVQLGSLLVWTRVRAGAGTRHAQERRDNADSEGRFM